MHCPTDRIVHTSSVQDSYTSCGALVGTRNRSICPSRGIDLMTYHTISWCSTTKIIMVWLLLDPRRLVGVTVYSFSFFCLAQTRYQPGVGGGGGRGVVPQDDLSSTIIIHCYNLNFILRLTAGVH